jgi:hypothetical protein
MQLHGLEDEGDARGTLNDDAEMYEICEIAEKASGDGYCVSMPYPRL